MSITESQGDASVLLKAYWARLEDTHAYWHQVYLLDHYLATLGGSQHVLSHDSICF